MPQNSAMTGSAHPAPHREKAPYALLAFCLFAAPIGWALHLLANTSIAGQNCVGAAVGNSVRGHSASALSAIYLIDLIAILLAAAAGYVAYELWTRTKEEKAGDVHRLVHAGEGRTRFLALCGLLTSILFGLAILADAIGVLVGPPC